MGLFGINEGVFSIITTAAYDEYSLTFLWCSVIGCDTLVIGNIFACQAIENTCFFIYSFEFVEYIFDLSAFFTVAFFSKQTRDIFE